MLGKKLIKAAAGNAGGANPYIEDVFSTYLYTGTDQPLGIENNIALGNFGAGTSTYLDGSSWLTTSTGLTGAIDSKTFTVSFWVNTTNPSASSAIAFSAGGNRFLVYCADTTIRVFGRNSGGSTILDIRAPFNILPQNAWAHVLVSCDMASTSLRRIYLNDVNRSITSTTYTNAELNFSNADRWGIGTFNNSSLYAVPQNLAHVYFDTTYRDLSVEANRRYFIDANGGSTSPATLTALNPILYVPMTSSYSIGQNLGSGGNFTETGTLTIENKGTEYVDGIGQGGLVWLKSRSVFTGDHLLFDTERSNKFLKTNSTAAEVTPFANQDLQVFNSNGFTLGQNGYGSNYATAPYASWTFRKAPKFFDCVTYTGTGSARTVSHNLGSVPGCIIVKRTDTTGDWQVYHRANTANPETDYLVLNSTAATVDSNTRWNDTLPTDSVFTVGTEATVNASGGTYVAYLFAHDAGGFGDDGLQNVISCGSYTGNGSNTGPTITLGWEPQWLLVRNADASSQWMMFDTMRGMANANSATNPTKTLYANRSDAEFAAGYIVPTATGFNLISDLSFINGNGNNIIYIAIRRGPMKTPTSGTEVFDIDTRDTTPAYDTTFPVDMALQRDVSSTEGMTWNSRLQGTNRMLSSSTGAETSSAANTWDFMNGWYTSSITSTTQYSWMFRRAPGFFDVVAYTGNGTTQAISHNLGVTPELLILKARSSTSNWRAISSSLQKYSNLNLTGAFTDSGIQFVLGNNTSYVAPTSTQFTLGSDPNATSTTYVAYLFATLAGVSKVGSYTGTGTTLQVDCGFSAGARFVMIKRTDSTGDWYVWDTARGIVAGNDPYLLLNSTAAEVTSTDYIDPLASGFEISSTAPAAINASGGTFIFLAIA